MKRLLKFKLDDDGVLVKYELVDQESVRETLTVESQDRPRAELREALKAMAEHLCTIAELPPTWAKDIEIRGVTCTHTNDIRGLVITGLRKLAGSNAPLVLNTPHFTEAPYTEDADSDVGIYTAACGLALDLIELEVWRYLDGEREQLQLGLTEEPTAVLHASS
jgi:hypothetical protein